MVMKFARKEDIARNIFILDLVQEFQIPISSIASGNFDHRCRCPSMDHKSGTERTESLYIDSVNNNYYCFGCQSHDSSIDFYMICTGKTFQESIQDLQSRIDPSKITSSKKDVKKNNFNILFQTSNLFRTYMKRYPNDLKWIEKLMSETDNYISKIKPDDIEKTKKLFHKIRKTLSDKYGEI